MKNIKVIGTSHIAKQSMDEIRKYILEEKPDIVALELDAVRFRNMFRRAKKPQLSDYKGLGIFGGLFGFIGSYLQKKLGSKVGLDPGIDMKTAALAAKEVNARIYLIDRELRITLSRLSTRMGGWEKARLVGYILFGGFSKENRDWFKKIDLTRVPADELIVIITRQMKKKFHNLYRVLVEERNEIMARNLKFLHGRFPDAKIVAVVGAGHKKELEDLLKHGSATG